MWCRRKTLCVLSLLTASILLLYLSNSDTPPGGGRSEVSFRQSNHHHHILSHGSIGPSNGKTKPQSQRITEFFLGRPEENGNGNEIRNVMRNGLDSSEAGDKDYGLYRQYDYEVDAKDVEKEQNEEEDRNDDTINRSSGNRQNLTVSPGTHHLPGALIIGAKKAGTRALLEFLRLHPSVKAAKQEIHFFDRHFHRGVGWYRRNLPLRLKGEVTIEKTPAYLVSPQVPGRVRDMLPDVKLLIVVREPATRALSDYAQSVSKHTPRKNFTQLVFADHSTGLVNVNWGPVVSGLYTRHLQRWLHYFPISSFHVVDGENLVVNPAEEMKEVEKFLKLRPFISPHHFYFNKTKGFSCIVKKENSTGTENYNAIDPLVDRVRLNPPVGGREWLNNNYSTIDPVWGRERSNNDNTIDPLNHVVLNNNYSSLDTGDRQPPDNKNNLSEEEHVMFMNKSIPVSRIHCLGSTKGREHPDVDPDTLMLLREFFRPFNEKFFRIIGKRFDWNR